MESSIKGKQVEAMKNHRRANFVYNFALYSLTSIITCLFFSYSFYFPSMNHFLASLLNNISFCLNNKCFFVVGNLIVFILVGQFKLNRSSYSSSTASDIYDHYVARSQSNRQHKVFIKKISNIEEKRHEKEALICHGEKKEVRGCMSNSMPPHDEKKMGLRASKSEVWGQSEFVRNKGKKEEKLMGMKSSKSEVWDQSEIMRNNKREKEEKLMGVKSSKSEVWGQSEIVRNNKGKKEKLMGMKSSKSEVWGESEIVRNNNGKKEENLKGMKSSKSEIWGQSEIVSKVKKDENLMGMKSSKSEILRSNEGTNDENLVGMKSSKSEVWGASEIVRNNEEKKEKLTGMRSSKSEVWGESEIVKSNEVKNEEKFMGMRTSKSEVWGENDTRRAKVKEEEDLQTRDDLNKRVDAFIARVNKQRLLDL